MSLRLRVSVELSISPLSRREMFEVHILPTFIENNSEPFNLMNWTPFGCKVSCERMVRSKNNIRILNDSSFRFAPWPVMFDGFERAV
jgi:hypothetical protein